MSTKAQEIVSSLKGYLPGIRTAGEMPLVQVVKTPWPSMNDVILGCGGIPRGRTIELYGKTSSGKTTIALNFIAVYHALGLITSFDDREGTLPGPSYTDKIGVDRDSLIMIDSSDGNDCLYQTKLLFALNGTDLHVIDSLPMILPRTASIVDNADDLSQYEKLQRATLLTGFFNQLRSGYWIGLPGTANKKGEYAQKDLIEASKLYYTDGKPDKWLHKLQDKDGTLIMINHQKNKPGQAFGDNSTTPGGDSAKFDASIRLRVTYKKRSPKKDSMDRPLFKIVNIRADKNKVAPPYGSADFKLHLDGRLEEHSGPVADLEDPDDE